MFVRKALLVSSVWPVSAPAEENISDQDIEKLMAKRDVIEAQVRENIGNAQERQKVSYDIRHNVENSFFFLLMKKYC